jgi:pimeloyl-ACP methyl ester carboxylesterase
MELAVRESDRICGLAISGSFAWSLKQTKARRFVRIVNSPLFRFLNLHLNFVARGSVRVGRKKDRFSDKEKAAILGPFRRREAREHLQNYFRGLRDEDDLLASLPKRMEKLRGKPVLLLYGAHDIGFKSGFLDRWKEVFPDHRAVVFSEAGHYIPEDEPVRYAEELKLWFDGSVKQRS